MARLRVALPGQRIRQRVACSRCGWRGRLSVAKLVDGGEAGAEKCEGAIGSLATVAPDRKPLAPPQHRLRIAIAGDFP
jgi:hypothetical protein